MRNGDFLRRCWFINARENFAAFALWKLVVDGKKQTETRNLTFGGINEDKCGKIYSTKEMKIDVKLEMEIHNFLSVENLFSKVFPCDLRMSETEFKLARGWWNQYYRLAVRFPRKNNIKKEAEKKVHHVLDTAAFAFFINS